MGWKFWKKQEPEINGGAAAVGAKLAKPKDLPEPVGRKMVVGMKMDPDLVWSLKYVSRPAEGRLKTSEFRIFDPEKAKLAGVIVKNWTSLDDRQELVMFAGLFDKSANRIDFLES